MMPLFQPDQYSGRVICQASECNEKSLFSDTKLGVVMKRQQREVQRCIGTDGCVAPWTAGRLCRATPWLGELRDMLAAFSFCGSVQKQIPQGLPHKKSQQSRR